jgi:benzodiazapine receptor
MKLSAGTSYAKLAASIILPLLVGFVGSIFTKRSVTSWYVTLRKPAITPPSWMFAPVWTALYIMMGIALYLVWRRGLGAPHTRTAIALFVGQLVLNGMWSLAFFGLRSPALGSAIISILWVVLLMTTIAFFTLSRAAGLLLVPYMLWTSYASVLTFWVHVLNR